MDDAILLLALASGQLVHEGNAVELTPTQTVALAAIVLEGETCDTATICENVWPGVDTVTGKTRLKIIVSQIRRRVGIASCIVSRRDGYAGAPSITTDLFEAERLTRCLAGSPTAREIEAASAIIEMLSRPRANPLHRQDWWTPYNSRLEIATLELGERLMHVLSDRGQTEHVINVARNVLRVDSLNEFAHLAIVEAYASRNDLIGAIAHSKRFCRNLALELDTMPSHEYRRRVESLAGSNSP